MLMGINARLVVTTASPATIQNVIHPLVNAKDPVKWDGLVIDVI